MPISRAIVLSSEIFGESDRYIQFLTRDWGVISTLAKAARKSKRRYVGGMDLFCHDEINVRKDARERAYLIELTVLNSFPKIREDLEKMLLGGKLLQWIRRLANIATPIPQVYSLLGQTLALVELQNHPERLELLELVFRLKLLCHLGIHPRIESCARCGAQTAMQIFDLGSGGLICSQCKPTSDHWILEKGEPDLLAAAKQLALTRFDSIKLPAGNTRRLLHLITQFTSYHTHTKLPV